jgi:uncharacterized protein (TIRG00374 family)
VSSGRTLCADLCVAGAAIIEGKEVCSYVGSRVPSIAGLSDMFARNPRKTSLFRLLIALLAIAWLLAYLDIPELLRVVIAPAWSPLCAMVAVSLAFILIGGAKLWLLVRSLTPVPFSRLMGYFLVATALGTFTPASLGDFSLPAFLRRAEVPVYESLAVMVVDRAITLSMYATIFLPLTLGLLLHTTRFWWVTAGVVVVIMVILALNGIATVRQKMCRVLEGLHLSGVADFLATASRLLRLHPWHLLGNIFLTFVRCVVSGLVVYLALCAAREQSPFLPVLYTSNSIALLRFLPISPAGLGLYEAGGVAVLGHLGLDRERVLAAFVYVRIYAIAYSLLVLAFYRMTPRRPPPSKVWDG